MRKRTILEIDGILDASSERGEAFVYEFLNSRDGIIDEECHNLLELLDEFRDKEVNIIITTK